LKQEDSSVLWLDFGAQVSFLLMSIFVNRWTESLLVQKGQIYAAYDRQGEIDDKKQELRDIQVQLSFYRFLHKSRYTFRFISINWDIFSLGLITTLALAWQLSLAMFWLLIIQICKVLVTSSRIYVKMYSVHREDIRKRT
jgi:hypothetical protein